MQSFSPEQMEHLIQAPFLVLKNITSIDGGGFFNALREGKAGLDFVREAMKEVPDNELIQEVGQNFLDVAGKETGPDTPTLAEFFVRMQQVVAVLGDHPDGSDFKAFLYTLGEYVASSSGTGFLGRGEKISPEEGAVLQALAQTFGMQ